MDKIQIISESHHHNLLGGVWIHKLVCCIIWTSIKTIFCSGWHWWSALARITQFLWRKTYFCHIFTSFFFPPNFSLIFLFTLFLTHFSFHPIFTSVFFSPYFYLIFLFTPFSPHFSSPSFYLITLIYISTTSSSSMLLKDFCTLPKECMNKNKTA